MKLALARTEEDLGVEGEDPIMAAEAVIRTYTKPLNSNI